MVGGKQGKYTGTWVCWEWEDSLRAHWAVSSDVQQGSSLISVVGAEPGAKVTRASRSLEQCWGRTALALQFG